MDDQEVEVMSVSSEDLKRFMPILSEMFDLAVEHSLLFSARSVSLVLHSTAAMVREQFNERGIVAHVMTVVTAREQFRQGIQEHLPPGYNPDDESDEEGEKFSSDIRTAMVTFMKRIEVIYAEEEGRQECEECGNTDCEERKERPVMGQDLGEA